MANETQTTAWDILLDAVLAADLTWTNGADDEARLDTDRDDEILTIGHNRIALGASDEADGAPTGEWFWNWTEYAWQDGEWVVGSSDSCPIADVATVRAAVVGFVAAVTP